MKNKHTPGPWTLKIELQMTEVGPLPIPHIVDKNGVFPNRKEDYQLMASAPELLEALKLAELELRKVSTKTGMSFFSLANLIEKAIIKAEGNEP